MKWMKKGLIFNVDKNYVWMQSHAQLPIPYVLSNEKVRFYFSTRDDTGKSRPAYVETEADDFSKVNYINSKPLMQLGERGAFDDCGVMFSSFVEFDKKIYMYYVGWNVGNTVSYRLSIGLAVSKDNGITFERYSDGPVMDRTINDPFFVASPSVLIDGGIFKMWYISCTGWKEINNKFEPVYLIKYAESKDGIVWITSKMECIKYKFEGEAIARPWVIKENNIYKMWYSTRGSFDYRTSNEQSYKIGYAESLDGITWERKDSEAGIALSEQGWDSLMLAYSSIAINKGKKSIIYNGNGFGKSGFGYAIEQE